MKIRYSLVSVIVSGLAGCSALPTAGPTTSQILDQAAMTENRHFDIVNVDNDVVTILQAKPRTSLRAAFQNSGKPPPPRIGVGDTIAITLYETGTRGLFGATGEAAQTAPASGTRGGVTLPEQVVTADGAISVPYAGRVHVAGDTPFEIQQIIDRRLADRVIEPQAIVTIAKSVSNMVTVSGEAITGARIPLSPRGERLLDVIASAGGQKTPLYETFLRLTRNGRSATIPMDALVSNPEENIYAWPSDEITLVRAPQTFSVFGATLNNTQLPFNADRVNLAQAIAKAGGLQDQRADPAGVFLFRFEPPLVSNALKVTNSVMAPDGRTAILYHLDLKQMNGYFLAARFPIENDDMIYVANAALTDIQKFFTLVGTITSPVINGVVVSSSVSH